MRNRTRRQDYDKGSNDNGGEDGLQAQSGVQDDNAELMPSRPLHNLFPASGTCEL